MNILVKKSVLKPASTVFFLNNQIKTGYQTNRVWQEGGIPTLFLSGDFNSDGGADVIQARGESYGVDRYKFFTYLGKKDGGLAYLGSFDTNMLWKEGNVPTELLPGDYNGDRRTIMVTGEATCYKILLSFYHNYDNLMIGNIAKKSEIS